MRPETRNSVILVLGTGTTAVLSLVYCVYAGRRLGPAGGYADFTAALAFASFCNIALGPINGTIAKFSAGYAARGEYGKVRSIYREAARRMALYGFVVFALAALAAGPVAAALNFQSAAPLMVACAMVYLTLLLSVGRGVLRGVQSFGAYNVNIVAEAAIRLTLGVAIFASFRTALAGLGAYILALLATLALMCGQLRGAWRGHECEPLDGAAIRRFVAPMFVMMGVSAGFENIDLLFVKHYFGELEAGVYGAAFILARAISVVATPFQLLILPLVASLYEQGRTLGRTFGRICMYFALLAAGPLLLFWLCSEGIVTGLYGPKYHAAAPLLLPLGLTRLVGYLGVMIALFYASMGRFGFLGVYVPGLVVQAAALTVWHSSLSTVVVTVLIVQSAALAGMVAHLIQGRRSRRRESNARIQVDHAVERQPWRDD